MKCDKIVHEMKLFLHNNTTTAAATVTSTTTATDTETEQHLLPNHCCPLQEALLKPCSKPTSDTTV